ncbi:MAG: hypothetical protein E5V52_06000, partial [Mesorhizobium sp.]
TIAGIKEASIVSDWSKRRARGERVPIEPPSMNADGSVTETTRMGRIDSPAGRKMAALDAEKEAKAKAQALAEKEAAKQAAQQPVVTAGVEPAAAQETQQAADADQGTVSKLKKKLLGMFGG